VKPEAAQQSTEPSSRQLVLPHRRPRRLGSQNPADRYQEMVQMLASTAGSASCPGFSEQAPTSLPCTPAYSLNPPRDLANQVSEGVLPEWLRESAGSPSRTRPGRGGSRLVLPDNVGAQADGRDFGAVGDDLDDPVVVVAAQVGGDGAVQGGGVGVVQRDQG